MHDLSRCRGAILAGVTLLVIAGGCSEQAPSSEPEVPLTEAALAPQAGGQVQTLGNYAAELVPTADGHLYVHLRDPQGQPVRPAGTTVSVEVDNAGTPQSVTLVPDVAQPRYVGVVPGVTGRRPVKVVLSSPDETAPEAETTFPDVALSTGAMDPNPWHNGQVSFVGDNRVEVAAAADGQVTVSVTDLDGRPVPPRAVKLKTVRITTPEGPRIVPLKARGPVFVGQLGGPPPPRFAATVDLGVRDRHYGPVRVRHVRPLPPGVVVQVNHRPPAPIVVRHAWGPPPPPAVDVHVGGPPVVDVHVGGPPVVDVHVGHPGKGWGKGHRRGHRGKGWGKGHRRGHRGKGWGKGHGRHGRGKGHGRGHGKRGRR